MRADDIVEMLVILGSNRERMQVVDREKDGISKQQVKAECPLSPWTHTRGTDRSRGFQVMVTETTPSFFHCFTCGSGGLLNNLLWHFERVSEKQVPEAWSILRSRDVPDPFGDKEAFGEYADPPVVARKGLRFGDLPTYPEEYLDAFIPEIPRYVMEREFRLDKSGRLSKKVAEQLGIRHDEQHDRAVFPIRSPEKKLVGAVGRSCSDGDPKWWNYWHFPRGRILVGEDQLNPGGSVAVVEGLFDLAWLRQCGVWNVVAILGSASVTSIQTERMVRLGRPLVLILDNDAAGSAGTEKIVSRAGLRVSVRVPEYPSGAVEPTDLSREDLIAMLSSLP